MRPLFAILLFSVLITGCSKHSGDGDSGRIAAVVNGVEITQREVEFLYQRNAVPGADEAAVRNKQRNILAGLVRAELLAQQGTKDGVDKSPEFMLAMHDARRRVLAGLEEEKISSTSEPVSPEVVRNVISENPDLFSARRLLVFDEVLISDVDVPFLKSLNASAGNGASLGQLLDALQAKGKVFQRSTKMLTSDQLQPAILTVLSGSKPKVPVVIRVEDRFSMILMLHSVTPVPVEGKAATLAATRMVEAQQRNMTLSQKMADVLDASKITYFGEFKADSASVKGGMAPLPTADPDRVAGRMIHSIRLVVAEGISFMGGMLLLFIIKTILSGKVWKFPLRLPSKKSGAVPTYDYDVHEVSAGVKLVVFIVSVLVLASMVFQLVLIWSEVPFWMLVLALFTGLLAGVGCSRLFALSRFRHLTLRFRLLLLGCFTLIVVAVLLVTMRIIFL